MAATTGGAAVRYSVSNRAKRFPTPRREQSHPRCLSCEPLRPHPARLSPSTLLLTLFLSLSLSFCFSSHLPPDSTSSCRQVPPSTLQPPTSSIRFLDTSSSPTPPPLLADRRDWRYQSHPRSRPLETPCCHFITSCTVVPKCGLQEGWEASTV